MLPISVKQLLVWLTKWQLSGFRSCSCSKFPAEQSKYVWLDFPWFGSLLFFYFFLPISTKCAALPEGTQSRCITSEAYDSNNWTGQGSAQQGLVNCSVEIAALKFTDVMIKQPLAKQKNNKKKRYSTLYFGCPDFLYKWSIFKCLGMCTNQESSLHKEGLDFRLSCVLLNPKFIQIGTLLMS